MKLSSYKNAKKEFVYNAYYAIVDNPMPYQKITRAKMLSEIIKVYRFPERIICCLSLNEIKALNNYLKDNKYQIDELTSRSLADKLLLLVDYEYFDLNPSIPEEYQDSLKEALNLINIKETKALDELNSLIQGLLMIYGTISLDKLISILQNYKLSFDQEYINKYITTNPRPRFYSRINSNTIEYLQYQKDEIIDKIKKIQNEFDMLDYKIWPKKDVIDLANNKFNHPAFKKINKIINKTDYYFLKNIFYNNFFIVINTLSDPEHLFDWLCQNPLFGAVSLHHHEDEFYQLYENYPSAGLKGHTVLDLENISSQNKMNIEMSSEANLSNEDCELFYDLYLALIEFANKKLRVHKHKKYYKANSVPPIAIHQIREKLFNGHLEIIDLFIKQNPYKFNSEELKIIEGFKNGILDDFIIVAHQKNGTIVASKNNRTYLIKGLISKMNEVCDAPGMANMLILPFKNQIVYDSIIFAYPIQMVPGIMKGLIKELSQKTPTTQLINSVILN